MKVYVGIDWSRKSHAVCCLDSEKKVLDEYSITHEVGGFQALQRKLLRLGKIDEILVGIETSHNSLVDFLLTAGFRIAPIHPNLIHHDRRSISSSGAKSDEADALLIARHLINNSDQLRILEPDSEMTVALRQLVDERLSIVRDETATCNRLNALLQEHLPAALGVFSSLKRKVTRAFLRAFPTQEALNGATKKDFERFLVGQRYSREKPAEKAQKIFKHVKAAARGPLGLRGEIGAMTVLAEIEKLETLLTLSKRLEGEMKKLLEEHPDGEIFSSFPGANTVLASSLLVLFGDDRARYRDAETLASLIGIVPVTKQSGQMKMDVFRFSCRRSSRHIFHLFTNLTRRKAPWAQKRYEDLRKDGKRHPHALRVLGRSWLRILFACWRTGRTYDPKMTESRAS